MSDSEGLQRYQELERTLLDRRRNKAFLNSNEEDDLLCELDRFWWSLTDEERVGLDKGDSYMSNSVVEEIKGKMVFDPPFRPFALVYKVPQQLDDGIREINLDFTRIEIKTTGELLDLVRKEELHKKETKTEAEAEEFNRDFERLNTEGGFREFIRPWQEQLLFHIMEQQGLLKPKAVSGETVWWPASSSHPHATKEGARRFPDEMLPAGVKVAGDFCLTVEGSPALCLTQVVFRSPEPKSNEESLKNVAIAVQSWYRWKTSTAAVMDPPMEPHLFLACVREIRRAGEGIVEYAVCGGVRATEKSKKTCQVVLPGPLAGPRGRRTLSISGPPASGKTILARIVTGALRELGVPVVIEDVPYPDDEMLRDLKQIPPDLKDVLRDSSVEQWPVYLRIGRSTQAEPSSQLGLIGVDLAVEGEESRTVWGKPVYFGSDGKQYSAILTKFVDGAHVEMGTIDGETWVEISRNKVQEAGT